MWLRDNVPRRYIKVCLTLFCHQAMHRVAPFLIHRTRQQRGGFLSRESDEPSTLLRPLTAMHDPLAVLQLLAGRTAVYMQPSVNGGAAGRLWRPAPLFAARVVPEFAIAPLYGPVGHRTRARPTASEWIVARGRRYINKTIVTSKILSARRSETLIINALIRLVDLLSAQNFVHKYSI